MTGTLTVRPMSDLDAEAVAAIEEESFTAPWDKQSVLSHHNSPVSRDFVAERDGEVVGYLLAQLIEPEGEVFRIAVAKKARRGGVGRKLLDALASCFGDGDHTIYLEVRKGNSEARALYRNFGFEETGERRNYYKDPVDDAVLMTYKAPSVSG